MQVAVADALPKLLRQPLRATGTAADPPVTSHCCKVVTVVMFPQFTEVPDASLRIHDAVVLAFVAAKQICRLWATAPDPLVELHCCKAVTVEILLQFTKIVGLSIAFTRQDVETKMSVSPIHC